MAIVKVVRMFVKTVIKQLLWCFLLFKFKSQSQSQTLIISKFQAKGCVHVRVCLCLCLLYVFDCKWSKPKSFDWVSRIAKKHKEKLNHTRSQNKIVAVIVETLEAASDDDGGNDDDVENTDQQ